MGGVLRTFTSATARTTAGMELTSRTAVSNLCINFIRLHCVNLGVCWHIQLFLAHFVCCNQRRLYVLPLFLIYLFFSDFCQIRYLNIYWTDLYQIFRVGRSMAVDERSEVSILISRGMLPW